MENMSDFTPKNKDISMHYAKKLINRIEYHIEDGSATNLIDDDLKQKLINDFEIIIRDCLDLFGHRY